MSEQRDQILYGSAIFTQSQIALDSFIPSTRPDVLQNQWQSSSEEAEAIKYLEKVIHHAGKDWKLKIPEYEKVSDEIASISIKPLDVVSRLYHVLGQDQQWERFVHEKGIKHTAKMAISRLRTLTGFDIDIHPTQLRYLRDLTEISVTCEIARSSLHPKTPRSIRDAFLAETILKSRLGKNSIIPPSALVDIVAEDDLFSESYIHAMILDSATVTVLEGEYARKKPVSDVYGESKENPDIHLIPTSWRRALRVGILGALAFTIAPSALAYLSTSKDLQSKTFELLKAPLNGDMSPIDLYWVSLKQSYERSLEEKYGKGSNPEIDALPENKNYKPMHVIIKNGLDLYIEKTGKQPFFEVAPGYEELSYYRTAIAFDIGNIPGILGSKITEEQDFVSSFFPPSIQSDVHSSLELNPDIQYQLDRNVSDGITDRATLFTTQHPNHDATIVVQQYYAEISNFTEQRSKEIGGPISASEIFAFVLEKNNGDIRKSMSDMYKFLKYAARSHRLVSAPREEQDTVYSEWLAKYVLDEYSYKSPSYIDLYHVAIRDTSYCDAAGPEYCNKNENLGNVLGDGYHDWDLAYLPTIMPPEVAADAWLAKFIKGRLLEQGTSKLQSDYQVIADLQEIRSLLDGFASNNENMPINNPDITVLAYPMLNTDPQKVLELMRIISNEILPENISDIQARLLDGEIIYLQESNEYIALRTLQSGDPDGNYVTDFLRISDSNKSHLTPEMLSKIIHLGSGQYCVGTSTVEFTVDDVLHAQQNLIEYQGVLLPNVTDPSLQSTVLERAYDMTLFSDGLALGNMDIPKQQLTTYLNERYPGWIKAGASMAPLAVQDLNISGELPAQVVYPENLVILPDGRILLIVPTHSGSMDLSDINGNTVGIIEAHSLQNIRSIEALKSVWTDVPNSNFLVPSDVWFNSSQKQVEFIINRLIHQSQHTWTLPSDSTNINADTVEISTEWLTKHGIYLENGNKSNSIFNKNSTQPVFVFKKVTPDDHLAIFDIEDNIEIDAYTGMPDYMLVQYYVIIDSQGKVVLSDSDSVTGSDDHFFVSDISQDVSLESSIYSVDPGNKIPLSVVGIQPDNIDIVDSLKREGYGIVDDQYAVVIMKAHQLLDAPYIVYGNSFNYQLFDWKINRTTFIADGSIISGNDEVMVLKIPMDAAFQTFIQVQDPSHEKSMRELLQLYIDSQILTSGLPE